MLQKDLESAGFLVNQGKSVWSPLQVLEWLGFPWDLNEGYINIPKQILDSLHSTILNLRSKSCFFSVRDLALLVGTIISFKFALGPVC
jgi:hypothetical protein